MQVAIPLKDMTTSDKLRAIETLWDDLSRNPESVPSPSWHAETLKSRSSMVKRGEQKFTSWDTAKRRIRSAVK